MTNLFGKEYNFPLLKNTREEIYFSTDRDRYIDIEKAIKVTNDNHFFKWLGIEEKYYNVTSYNIYTQSCRNGDTVIEIEIDTEEDVSKLIEKAENKFNNHVQSILNRIEEDINYRYTDEAILEDYQYSGTLFLEDGTIYQY